MPAAAMPMATEVWRFGRHHDDMTDADLDDALTTGAEIALARLVRLDRLDEFVAERCIGVGVGPAGIGHVGSIGSGSGGSTIIA